MLHARKHIQVHEYVRFFYWLFVVLEKQNYTRIEGRRLEEIIAITLICSFYTLSAYCKTGAPDLSYLFLECWWEQISWESPIFISTLFLGMYAKSKILHLYLLSKRRNMKISIMDLTGRIAFAHSVTKIDKCKWFQWKKAPKQKNLSPQNFLHEVD